MPELMTVKTLYISSLNATLQQLYKSLRRSSQSVAAIRKVIQATLHAGIRQHLIHLAIKTYRNRPYLVLDLLAILLDKGIKRLLPLGEDSDFIAVDPCTRLFAILDQCGATGLQELTIKVDLHSGKRRYMNMFGDSFRYNSDYVNTPLYHVLRTGLAGALLSVTLNSVCDNEILRLLGRHAPLLQHLDVASSWLVDDGGLKQLCFKHPEQCQPFPLDGLLDASSLVDSTFGIGPTEVNACCKTLMKVRIQDTNTTEFSVAVLLLFLPNLKSLGGFIYYRNVGDAILSLIHSRELSLNLTALWDTSLPPNKAASLNKVAPHLTNLYTQASHLVSVSQLSNITQLTLDFDFINYVATLEQYLSVHGEKLSKLVLVDQNHAVDLGMLALYCPNLEDLGATVEGSGWKETKEFLPKLTTCRVRLSSNETVVALLSYASKLEHFEVFFEEERYGGTMDRLHDNVLASALAHRAPQNLRLFLVRSVCHLSILAAAHLRSFCPKLRVLGDLNLWGRVSEFDVERFAAEIKATNIQLALFYRGLLYPLCRQYSALSVESICLKN